MAVLRSSGYARISDRPSDQKSQKFVAASYEVGKLTNSLYHAWTALANVLLTESSSVEEDRKVAGLCSSEESTVKIGECDAVLVETWLIEVGARFSIAQRS